MRTISDLGKQFREKNPQDKSLVRRSDFEIGVKVLKRFPDHWRHVDDRFAMQLVEHMETVKFQTGSVRMVFKGWKESIRAGYFEQVARSFNGYLAAQHAMLSVMQVEAQYRLQLANLTNQTLTVETANQEGYPVELWLRKKTQELDLDAYNGKMMADIQLAVKSNLHQAEMLTQIRTKLDELYLLEHEIDTSKTPLTVKEKRLKTLRRVMKKLEDFLGQDDREADSGGNMGEAPSDSDGPKRDRKSRVGFR